jgi:hypothetical protein
VSDDPTMAQQMPPPPAQAEPQQQPAPEAQPQENPWAALEGKIDPTDPHLLDAYQWGRDIMDEDRRAQAVEYLLEQDPRLRQYLAQRLAAGDHEPDQEYDYSGHEAAQNDFQAAQQVPEPVNQALASLAANTAYLMMEREVERLGARENLTDEQKQTILDFTFGQYQQGRVQDISGAVQQSLAALRQLTQVWQPPPPPQQQAEPQPEDPSIALARQVAQQQQAAPQQLVGQGPAVSGTQAPQNLREAADLARQIAQMNRVG